MLLLPLEKEANGMVTIVSRGFSLEKKGFVRCTYVWLIDFSSGRRQRRQLLCLLVELTSLSGQR